MKKILIIIGLVITLMLGGCFIYVSDYYHASEEAMSIVRNDDEITIEDHKDYIAFIPDDIHSGFIFYPGGLVETESYAPLLKECAKQGILCVLVEMPFHLAVLNVNGADGILDNYDIENWYIGGHSLGGSMAASYLSNHIDEFEGLILLASYSTEDLSDTDLEVLSLYGSEDQVLNMEKYEENKVNLPSHYKEYIIDGGNHAYFGSYGEQDGDGKATLSSKKQIDITVNNISDIILH